MFILLQEMSRGQLVAPENFGMIEEDLYRFGCPNEYNLSFIEELKLSSVVYLAPTQMPSSFKHFLDSHNIALFHPDSIQETKDPWSSLSHDVVVEVLEFILHSKVSTLVFLFCAA